MNNNTWEKPFEFKPNKDIEKINEEASVKTAAPKKKKKSLKIVATATALACIGAGYTLIKSREKAIISDVSTKSVIASVNEEQSIDDVLALYSSEIGIYEEKTTIEEAKVNSLFNDFEIISRLDTIENMIAISNDLEDLKLHKIIDYDEGLRELSAEEKLEVENTSLNTLRKKIKEFKETDVNYKDFSEEAIEYNRLAMDLEYAEDIINSQIISEGNETLKTYGQLIIQSKIIDATHLDPEEYKNLSITNGEGDSYAVKYTAQQTGQHFIVNIKDKDIKDVLDYCEYFEETADQMTNDDFKKYKKEAVKAINHYKKSILSDYKLYNRSDSNDSWAIKNKSSNHEVVDKIKKLSK